MTILPGSIVATCRLSGKKFLITQADQNFYAKMGVPLPTLCPEERCRRRLGWQNMKTLYNRTCDATGASIITNISKDKLFPVYDSPYWWSDAWDAREYGRDFDFSRPFFEQFQELLNVVPQPNLGRSYLLDQNSDYTNYAGGNKNCYLIFHADMNEDCMYGVGIKKCKNVVDCFHTHSSELMYESVDCRSSYGCAFCQDCENCSHCWFTKNCIGCSDCFGCINLRQKKYCIFNKQYTKEEYEKMIRDLPSWDYHSLQSYRKQVDDFHCSQPQKDFQGYKNDNCTGDHIFYCKDVYESFDIQESRDMKFCHRIYNGPNADCYDLNEYGMHIERVYEGLAIGINAYDIITGVFVNEQVSNIYYSIHVHHAKHCFGCIGLSRGEYCILNKQYSQQEYEALLPKMIEHMKGTREWGEFFPLEMSPFGYNETVAQEYFPLEKFEVEDLGLTWKDEAFSHQKQQLSMNKNIDDISDDILQETLYCEESGKPYKIKPLELEFLRKMKLPLPQIHPDIRHIHRFNRTNDRKIYERTCHNCNNNIQTTYSPERSEIVYCEQCYEQVVE